MVSNNTEAEIPRDVLENWRLSPVKQLGGTINHHWLVDRAGKPFALRRYHSSYRDIAYELQVLRRLKDMGWPVAVSATSPEAINGSVWCLFEHLVGEPVTESDASEQRARGRLLAELHQSTASLVDLGQRSGFDRCDAIARDESLLESLRSYEKVRPEVARMMRWHLERAREHLESLDLDQVAQTVIHGDFMAWNLIYSGGELSGILDFEFTHLNFRVADFALSWRGRYDDVISGYEDVQPLSDLDRAMLVPCFWCWLFIGVKDEIERMSAEKVPVHGFEWQTSQLMRRSPLFGELVAEYHSK